MITYAFANSNDLEEISQLLNKCGLPSSDIVESKVFFIVAREDNQLLGCIGLEKYTTNGLIRSFSVEPSLRNLGCGAELYSQMLKFSTDQGIHTLHLLTNTASAYFLKKGFRILSRDIAPKAIQNTKEFMDLCPSTSTYMVKSVNQQE